MTNRFDLFTAEFIYRKIQLSELGDYAWRIGALFSLDRRIFINDT